MSERVWTAGEAIAAVRSRWPTAREDSEILDLLSACENTVRAARGEEAVDALQSNTPLTAPWPYAPLYAHYAAAHLAQLDGETLRYNEELALFYGRWNDYITAHRRENLPPERCAVGFANRGVRV